MTASKPDDKVWIIGIVGGTGAGKTTIAQALQQELGESKAVIIPQDAYYRDRSHLLPEERAQINYDHPEAFENGLLLHHLNCLKSGEPIDRPVYDFTTHTRKSETIRINPVPIIILEGIMVLANEEIRRILDYKIYIDTDADLRILRRLERDIKERGRSFEDVKEQYLKTVHPMYLKFVEPSKRYADIIIPGGYNQNAVEILIGKLTSMM
ncbi:MAG: uridine kinase [Candidatus Bipolaricaulia bacterium]